VGLAPGTKIGKYEVVERLGIGGQAIVYKCHDALLDREVAVKQVSSALAEDPQFLQRFRKEAQILARLGAEQPAIVTIHELVEDERGLFIVMEHVAGHSLETILRDNPDPVEPKAALQIIWRLAAALHAVHAAGVVHRDIKPSNIIIGEGLRAKIMDFGVAASVTGQSSMPLGTTKYMAPELFEGDPADGRVDMYSLGFIAYEMLVGRRKFNEIFADVVRDRHSEVLRWMKWHGNRSVSAPMVHEVNPAVPPQLGRIVGKMIAKDPAQRYASMEELGRAIKANFSSRGKAASRPGAGALAGAGPGEPVVGLDTKDLLVEAPTAPPKPPAAAGQPPAEGPATAPLPKKKMSRKTKLVLAGALAGAAVIAGIVLLVVESSREAARRRAAEARYREALTKFKTARDRNEKQAFEEAIKAFASIRDAPGAGVVGDTASFWVPLGRAYIAAIEENWDKAMVFRREAEEALGEIQGRYSTAQGSTREKMMKWVRDRRDDDVATFEDHYTDSRQFSLRLKLARALLAGIDTLDKAWKEAEDGKGDKSVEAMKVSRQAVQAAGREAGSDDLVRSYLTGVSKALQDCEEALRLLPGDAESQDVRDMVDQARKKAIPLARGMLDNKLGQFARTPQQQAAVMGYRERVEAAETALAESEAQRQRLIAQDQRRHWEREVARMKGACLGYLGRAKELASNSRIQDAWEAHEKAKGARSSLEDHPMLKDVTPRERGELNELRRTTLETMNTAIEEARLQIKVAEANFQVVKQYNKALHDADLAKAKGDREQELRHLQEAVKLKPDAIKTLQPRIKTVTIQIELQRALKLKAEGQVNKAIERLEDIVKRDPQNRVAQQALEQAKREVQWARLVQEADAALSGRRWQEALEKYEQAKRIRSLDKISENIARCQYEIGLAEGDQQFNAGQFDAAIRTYQQLFRVMPSRRPIIEARLRRVEKRQEYNSLMADGDSLMEKRKWLDARNHYSRAMKLYPDDAERRGRAGRGVAKAMYWHWLTMGQERMRDSDYRTALACFKNALNNARIDEEIERAKTLIAAAEAELARQEEEA
jgi:tetratricopeptide (TPR) repeat protein